ncbi:hypothetical protein DFJ58DRAFT_748740 [Suillus subalutaceus]|uniref:uncharacterized protein n=1 Tax=Suillus subalutaceus TaxID=48586 RepID=UPI001B87C1DA|nr:uncharacterized protein DFJ58DRAFT_748740 [Suillus subalutaceus]KAG1840349.1 hypothetical protein DFJ58DRAFT_748740 [Suillus subalutaceus]
MVKQQSSRDARHHNHGVVKDPYEESCVKESKFISKDILEVDSLGYTLRDGSTLSSKRQHTGVPPPRTAVGRLPGGAYETQVFILQGSILM